MTPPRSIMTTIVHSPVMRSPWLRRVVLGGLALLFGFLSFFPERYRAAVTLTPTDPTSFGLSGALGQLGAINSVFGNQTAVEVALKVARGVYVQETAAQQLKLKDRLHLKNDTEAYRWLNDNINIRSLRGGIILYEYYGEDQQLGRDLVGAYASATQARLAQIARRQTEYKRDVLMKLVSDSSDRLARARAAYNNFRLGTRYADPEQAMEAIGARIPVLEASIKAKQVQLNAARQFATDDNMQVRQILAELGALQAQLNQAKTTSTTQENSVGRVVSASTEAERLARELKIAQTLYDSYVRFLEGTSVEDMTSTASVRVLEPPFIDTQRQVNYRFAALAVALALLLAAIEFYRLRPPVTDRLIARETYA